MRTPCILALLLAQVAWGQEKKTLALRLAQAVELAVAPDGATRLRLAREWAAEAAARRRQALGALLPNVDGAYTFRSFTVNLASFGIQSPALPGLAFPTLAGPFEVNDVRSSATQSIFDLAAIRRYQAAKAQVKAASAESGAALNQTKGAVAKAYLNAVRASSALDAARANVALAERILKLARSQKESGTGTGIEVTRAEVTLAQERQRLIAATEGRSASLLQLLRAMNTGFDFEVELTEPLVYAPAEIPEAARAVAAARELRPELKAQAAREEAARLNAAAAKWERLPSLAAFGDYGVTGRTGGAQLPTRTAGVSLRIPLWDGGRRGARRAEAGSILRQESIRALDTARQVELEIRLAIEALKSAEAQVAAARETFSQAERELAQAERRVEAGVASGLEVTDAQARLARARESVIEATFLQKAARIDLGVAVGNIDMVLD